MFIFLQHTEVQNGWWGRGGGGAPTYSTRRHDVANTFENPRQKWVCEHILRSKSTSSCSFLDNQSSWSIDHG